jgi:hypothetical protein
LFTTNHMLPEGAELNLLRALSTMGPRGNTTGKATSSSSSGAVAAGGGGGGSGFKRPDDAAINSFCTRVNQAAQKFDKVGPGARVRGRGLKMFTEA